MTAPETTPLPPCPFCGSSNAIVLPRTCDKATPYNAADRAFPVVRCKECGAETPGKNWGEPSSAISAWTRRAALAGAQPPVTGSLPELPQAVAHVHSNGEVCMERSVESNGVWPVELVTLKQAHDYARAYAAAAPAQAPVAPLPTGLRPCPACGTPNQWGGPSDMGQGPDESETAPAQAQPPEQEAQTVGDGGPACAKCKGARWLWWHELDDYSGPATTGGADDTRYPCDACGVPASSNDQPKGGA